MTNITEFFNTIRKWSWTLPINRNFSAQIFGILVLLFGLDLSLYAQLVQAPTLSHSSGFYSEEFSLSIAAENPNDIILYTLDGSVPKIEHLSGKEWKYKLNYKVNPSDNEGQLINDTLWTKEYVGPISIKDISNDSDKIADISTSYLTNDTYYAQSKALETPVYKGVCLRVVAYRDGIYSDELTKNYFIGEERKYSIPMVCLAIEPDQFFGFVTGINVPGIDFDNWRMLNPQIALDNYQSIFSAPGNFRRKGINTELKINFSYWVEGNEVLNHGAGIRINGNTSRYYPNRSLRLYAKNGYGPKKFEYPFFEDSEEDEFKRLILRNAGNDTEASSVRDAFVGDVSEDLNVIAQAYQPTIVFINGEYHGLYNLRERFDKKYFNQHFGIHEDSLDYIKINEAKEGNTIALEQLYQFMLANDFTDDNLLKALAERVDLDNLIDFYIVETFMGNWDWPHNNHELFRKRVDFDSLAEFGNDGRWRFLVKDLDASLGIAPHHADYTSNDFEQFREASGHEAIDRLILPFVYSMKNSTFKHRFINRYCDVLNSTYKTDVLQKRLEEMTNVIRPEISESAQRWNPQNKYLLYYWPVYSLNKWEQHVEVIYEYIENRASWVRTHLNDEYSLGTEKEIILDVSDNNGGIIHVNTLKLNEDLAGVNQNAVYPWKGIYYSEVPVLLKAEAKAGFEFTHWSGKVNSTSKELSVKIDDVNYLKANFKRTGESISEEEKVSVFPNPFSEFINIYAESYEGEYKLVDMKGSIVSEGKLTSTHIDLSHLKSGVYFLNIIYESEIIRRKLLKIAQ
ncbi:CotH kinase family protein [Brumimicrobium oceani]|uniref:Secretion system C-terminal sorting domain-containing protein n=1 Tax=Brumimicrobium oceani TaxID=2100725 RepID=A0A2U2XFD4_9FLAO|nr:CotH kinase family protein [Brumimicrobium oceani]PWH86450.1 hypothetical protein DIT68_04220 [Brumimicrobium oceani]